MSISRPKRATDDNHMALIKEDLLMGLQAAIVEDCRPCNCKKSIHLFPFQLQSLFDLSSLSPSAQLAPLAPLGSRRAHLDAVAGAVLAIGGGQMQQVGPVLRQQRVAGEVRAEAACQAGTGKKIR